MNSSVPRGDSIPRSRLFRKFCNLTLITVSGNSKFSNLSPVSKIDSYPNLIKQSLKLTIMKEMTRLDDEKWTKEKVIKHQDEMYALLKNNITQKSPTFAQPSQVISIN
ncbi:DUF1524 domain-containing protein [Exiguobacterium sp. H66]|uniref:GmrSD restriction endonuclease domain-containing protein n=1 Tax=Exiguobacterium sp. H66 TaxID=2751208 RepID=UPI001BEA7EC6